MHSEMRRRLRSAMPHREEGQAELERETGINIERDINHVTAFLTPVQTADRDTGMVLASGRFDVVRLEGLAREHGGEVRRQGQTPRDTQRQQRRARREPDRRLHGARSRGARRYEQHEARDRRRRWHQRPDQQGNDGSRPRPRREQRVGGRRFDALMSHANLPQGVANQIPAIRWFSASGHVNGGLNGSLRAETRDDQAGQNLRDVVNGFLALARMQAGEKPGVQASSTLYRSPAQAKTSRSASRFLPR